MSDLEKPTNFPNSPTRTITPKATTADEVFWLAQFTEPPTRLELPLDHLRPPVRSFKSGRVAVALQEETCIELQRIGVERDCSLFMTTFAAFSLLLHRVTGQDQVVVGTLFDSDTHGHNVGAPLVASATRILPLCSRVESDPRLDNYLEAIKRLILSAAEYKQFPFRQLQHRFNLPGDLVDSPFFSILFSFDAGEFKTNAAKLTFELLPDEFLYAAPLGTTIPDLHLNVAEKNGGLELRCDYSTDLFEQQTVQRWLGYLKRLLEGIAANLENPISQLPLLSEAERQQIVVKWNDTKRKYPSDVLLHKLVETQVELSPDAVALVFDGEPISYGALNGRANQLAHRLCKLGVGPNTVVGIFAERSIEMVIGLLATLKANGAYLPLDPNYPIERLGFMLGDAQPHVVLTQRHLTDRLPQNTAQLLFLDEDLNSEIDTNPSNLGHPEDLAYVIYTSGSTGQPKGAMNTHRGICNRLLWMQETYRLTAEDRVLQKTPFTFDVSVWEFFWPLLAGARMVIARPGLHGDSSYLIDNICTNSVTTVHFVPPMLAAFLEDRKAGRCSPVLRRVICSGEALPFDLQERFFAIFPNVELHNLYGPTEAAVDVTFWKCQRGVPGRVVPIGRPIANTQMYVLDRAMQPVPIGVAGELHIGGVQLARGYLARPELTAEKFVPNPFGDGRLYKTGDLARYRSDGAIEFLGRIDHQVKLRGFRIELGEIEGVIKKHCAVRECVALVREEGIEANKRLVAYVVAGDLSPDELRQHAQQSLPEYMVPSAFVFLDRLPLTANGKLDRRALPAPEKPTDQRVQPQTAIERTLVNIWRTVLGVDWIGVDDNFFELGGDSLTALRVVNQLRELIGNRASLALVHRAPTVAQLAKQLEMIQFDQRAPKPMSDKHREKNSEIANSARNSAIRVLPRAPQNSRQ
jgi:amino acid adenylation domain-containing protein